MTARMRKILRVIVDGLILSAQATAMREGLPWDRNGSRPAHEHLPQP